MMVRRNCMDEDDFRTDDLVSRYKLEAQESISTEAERRVSQTIPMKERIRLRALSLHVLVEDGIEHPDLIPALLERLGPVRAALDGHGGGVAGSHMPDLSMCRNISVHDWGDAVCFSLAVPKQLVRASAPSH